MKEKEAVNRPLFCIFISIFGGDFLFLKQHKSPFTTERDGSMISFIIYIA